MGTRGWASGGAESIRNAAHPGQILLSQSTRDLLRETPLDTTEVLDLGEHRLTDLAAAQRLFQLVVPDLEGEFPPPRGLEARPTNLPLQPTPLVGREREIREVVELVRGREARVVTLTGTGGTGKTRLAAQVAAELLDEFPDGVFFVSLAPLASPGLVMATVARTLGVPESGADVGEALARHLRDRRLLLLLDNFEHVLEVAPAMGRRDDVGSEAPCDEPRPPPPRDRARLLGVTALKRQRGTDDVGAAPPVRVGRAVRVTRSVGPAGVRRHGGERKDRLPRSARPSPACRLRSSLPPPG